MKKNTHHVSLKTIWPMKIFLASLSFNYSCKKKRRNTKCGVNSSPSYTVEPCSNRPPLNGILPLTDTYSWSLQPDFFYLIISYVGYNKIPPIRNEICWSLEIRWSGIQLYVSLLSKMFIFRYFNSYLYLFFANRFDKNDALCRKRRKTGKKEEEEEEKNKGAIDKTCVHM